MTFAEVTTALPVPGAATMHSYFTHGQFFGFSMGWILWSSLVFSIPLEIQGALHYSSSYFPWMLQKGANGHELSQKGVFFAFFVMAIISIINAFSVKAMSKTNSGITFWKLLVPAGIAIVYLTHPSANFSNLTDLPGGFNPYGWKGILTAIASGGIVYSFTGFQFGLMLAGEVKNPQKSVPKAAIASICSCLVLYLLLQLAFLVAIPGQYLENGWDKLSFDGFAGPLASIGVFLGLHWLVHILQVDAAISPTGSALVQTASASRIVYSMSLNGSLPKWFSWLNKGKVPVRAIILNFFVSSIVFLPFFNLKNLFALLSTVEILTFIPGPICLYVFRQKHPKMSRPFSLIFPNLWAYTAFLICSLLLYWVGFSTVWKVLLVVFFGAFAYLINNAYTYRSLIKSLKNTEVKNSLWFFFHLTGMCVISALGTFEGGNSTFIFPYDLILIAVFSGFTLYLSSKSALPLAQSEEMIKSFLIEHQKTSSHD